ncbi:hypothetical protein KCG43_00985 [Photobacterium sp. WH24]|uniref:hypothetical protein n=1 Tax=Photobacterium sp. WH24 TaxID=2827237 RepID=UPI001C46EA05|nr:hypothetical protein [Photobacterium sp. WH24]MBV7260591.1 hypothetical protein [Photobacterium sp. WH24]
MNQLVLKMLLLFSGFYLAGVTSLSPIYFIFSLVLFFTLITVFTRNYILSEKYILFCLIPSVSFFYQYLLTTPSLATGVIINFVYALLLMLHLKKAVLTDKILLSFIVINLLYCLLDGFWRVLHPDTSVDANKLAELGLSFHIYKTNSLMYIDSNTVGLQVVAFLAFYYWLVISNHAKFSFYIFLLASVAVFLTFSRAAYAGYIFLQIIMVYYKTKWMRYLLLISVPISMLFLIGQAEKWLLSDYSFLSKFKIISLTFDYLSNVDFFTALIGVGAGNGEYAIGMGTHNIFVTWVVELGFIGAFVYTSFFLYFCLFVRNKVYMILLPIFLVGSSASSLAIPYVFCMMVLAKHLKENRLGVNMSDRVGVR